jgi:hypothetical protein
MPQQAPSARYCLECGHANALISRYCKHCGRLLAAAPAERVRGMAFLLNEAQTPEMGALLSAEDRSRLVTHYESRLRSLITPAREEAAPRPAPAPAPAARPVAPAAAAPVPAAVPAPIRAAAPPPRRAAAGPRFRPPAPPRPPRDWSWLAEQQANLFLFAGAFMVVIAALIFAAYPGREVEGGVRMALLSAFTLAFLAAGLVCLRIPRVAAAGQVFFGVGAILVPLGFVAAYEIFSGQQLDANAMWLAGSLTTAMLYTAVATLGMGRLYAFSSGVALFSAAAAACSVADLPIEWTPVPFLVLALAMSAIALGGPGVVRRRLGRVWSAEAHVVAAASIIAAIIMALTAAPDEAQLEIASRWFLPAAFLAAAAYASLHTVSGRNSAAGVALVAMFGGAFVTVVYAFSWPAEQYTIAFAALALLLGVMLPVIETERAARRLPADAAQSVHAAAIAATLVAAGVGFLIASTRPATAPHDLVPQTHWFAAPALALLLAFYLLDAFGRRQRAAVIGSALALAGLGASFVYGFEASAEYYAFALTGAGAAIVIFLRWIVARLPERFAHPATSADVSGLVHVALGSGVAVAIWAANVAAQPESTYAPQTPWFLFGAFASALAAYALYVTLPMPVARPQDRLAFLGLGLAIIGSATSVVYGLDASSEYYAHALTGSGIVLVAILWLGLPRVKNPVLLGHVDPGGRLLAQSALVTGVAVAITAAIAGSDPNSAYEPQTPWFLFAAFASAFAGYALYATLRMRAAQWHDHLAHVGLAAALVGACTSVVYGLDASAEYYSFAFVAGAGALLAIAWQALPRLQPEATTALRDDYVVTWHAAALAAGVVAVGAVFAASAQGATYHPESRWFLPILFAALATFYALATASRIRFGGRVETLAPLGFAASIFGVTTGVVYALDASAEYYAFAFLVPAIAFGAAGRWGAPGYVSGMLAARWQPMAMAIGRTATATGLGIAVIAAIVAAVPDATYQPDARIFLPLAFLVAAVFLAFDASRKPLWWTTAALLAALGGAGVSTVYAIDPGVQYYGVAFASAGILFGFGGRTWSPRWIHANTRDLVATIAITTAWLAFEGVYVDHEQIGAGVHLTAAVFYAMAALVSRSGRTVGQLIDLGGDVPVAAGWLYASGLVTTVGYVLLLRGLREGAGAGSLPLPLLGLALGFLLVGATARFWRAEFSIHLYIMGLLLSIGSLSSAPDAAMLAALLTVFIGAFVAVAVWEDEPLFAVPAAVFGFMAVAAWQQRLDAPQYVVPVLYSTVAACAYVSGFALRGVAPRWSSAMRACGATYGLVAPAAGYGMLGSGTEKQIYAGAPFEESALYQWSTAGVALVGVLATIEASIARRGGAVVLGSAVLAASLLLEIGHIRPDNNQAYTAVIGVYVLLLGLLGLWKFRLLPEFEDAAPAVEALGAAIIMIPSFREALAGGWQYLAILLVESAVFFTISVALRRRLLLGTALLAIVLIAGRALFDVINALPNYIVFLIAGLALLGIGTAILIGRDRWARWEHAILSWWDHTGTGGRPPQHAG